MAIDLSGGSFIDAFDKQEDRLLARRAKNRDIYDKMMTDATARGEKMTVEQITDLRTELSNGNNFFAGYVPRGEILQQNITRQNERASNVMDIENTARMKREDDERGYINNQADTFSDKSLRDFTTGMTGLLGERATELAEQNGGMETWWKNSRERKQTKLFQDPRVQNLMSEQEVENQYGHLPPHLQKALKGYASTNALKDLQTRTTSAYGDIQNLPADILSVASQDPKSATAIAAKNTFVRSIISKYRLPEGEQGKLLQIVNDRIALGNTGYKKDNMDKYEEHMASPEVVSYMANLDEKGLADYKAAQIERFEVDPTSTGVATMEKGAAATAEAADRQTYNKAVTTGMAAAKKKFEEIAKVNATVFQTAASRFTKGEPDHTIMNAIYNKIVSGGVHIPEKSANLIADEIEALVDDLGEGSTNGAAQNEILTKVMSNPAYGITSSAAAEASYMEQYVQRVAGPDPKKPVKVWWMEQKSKMDANIDLFKNRMTTTLPGSPDEAIRRNKVLGHLKRGMIRIQTDLANHPIRFRGEVPDAQAAIADYQQAIRDVTELRATGTNQVDPTPGLSQNLLELRPWKEKLKVAQDNGKLEDMEQALLAIDRLESQGAGSVSAAKTQFENMALRYTSILNPGNIDTITSTLANTELGKASQVSKDRIRAFLNSYLTSSAGQKRM